MSYFKNGFTLIELVVVIAIIGILGTVGVASYNNVLENSRETKAQTNLEDVKKSIETARIVSGKTLGQITGNWCSECTVCRGAGDMRNAPDSHPCVARWYDNLSKIGAAGKIDVSNIRRDPWGSPFTIDENDGEFPTNRCRIDRVTSPGPDGILGTSDDIHIRLTLVYPGC